MSSFPVTWTQAQLTVPSIEISYIILPSFFSKKVTPAFHSYEGKPGHFQAFPLGLGHCVYCCEYFRLPTMKAQHWTLSFESISPYNTTLLHCSQFQSKSPIFWIGIRSRYVLMKPLSEGKHLLYFSACVCVYLYMCIVIIFFILFSSRWLQICKLALRAIRKNQDETKIFKRTLTIL